MRRWVLRATAAGGHGAVLSKRWRSSETGMKPWRSCSAMAVVGMLAAGLLAAAAPQTAVGASNCTTSQLIPALGDVTINQGLGTTYAYKVRGKETLVKFFLTKPTNCTLTSTQSINITGATLTVNNTLQTFPPFAAFQSFAAAPAVTATASTNSPADPIFAVPANDLVPAIADTQTFTPTFTATVAYSRKSGTSTTSGLTTSFSNSSATFDHKTRALRVLVVPMGDATPGVLASTQYTAADQTATQNGFSALSRIFPVPSGVSVTGGIRYTINLSAMLNLKTVPGAYDANGRFCGSAVNFDAIKAQLAQFMQSWNANSLNADKQVDRVLGVVGEGISDGADTTGVSCADGMASVVSPEAWVRAIADKPASGRIAAKPSRTGSLMAMELTHTWGGTSSTSHHSANVAADVTDPGRAFNVTTRAFLGTNRSAMKFSAVTSPPWDDTLTLLEPADYAYDLCAFGGSTTSSCATPGTAGTTLGVAAGPAFVVSGTAHKIPGLSESADIVQSGFANSLLIGSDERPLGSQDSSPYRYVRRNSSTGAVETNLGFIVSFKNSFHAAADIDDPGTTEGLFSFALSDDLPAPGSDLAEVQLWKVSSASHTNPSTANGDTLLYDKTQQPTATQLLGFNTLGAAKPAKYTDTAGVDEVHPALSDDGKWVAWEAPLDDAVLGSPTVIHVAPASSATSDVTLPLPAAASDTGLSDAFPAWKHGDALAYAFDGDLYVQHMNTSGATASVVGSPERIYDGDPSGDVGPPAAHHPSWSLDGGSIAFDADGDIYTIAAAGGSPTKETTSGEPEHDPSWSHTAGENRIAYVRGPLGPCTPSTKLYVVDPVTDTDEKVGDEGCGLFPSFGTNARIAFLKPDGNIWSTAPDGTAQKQLTIGGQDSFPSAAGTLLAFDRTFSSGSCPPGTEFCLASSQLDIMLTELAGDGTGPTAFSASSNVALKAEVDHEVNGTAYPVYVGLEPDEVDGAIQTWYINFDGSNAPSGGVLRTRFTDGVQYTVGTSVLAPTVAPKPPTAAIFSPLDTTYLQGATFALSGSGYDAEGKVLPESSLHWTLKLPNGASYALPNGGNFASTDLPAPLPAGWPAGTSTFTLVASDGTLSSAPVTRDVRVLYKLVGDGFLPPIRNPPQINTAKTGTQYPIKWQLTDASGRYISDLNTVASVAYQIDGPGPTCDFFTATGPFIPLPTGKTVLRYDTKSNQFVYNWITPATRGCYVFQVTLTDGSDHQAWFQLS